MKYADAEFIGADVPSLPIGCKDSSMFGRMITNPLRQVVN
jgi:hypothetical protein